MSDNITDIMSSTKRARVSPKRQLRPFQHCKTLPLFRIFSLSMCAVLRSARRLLAMAAPLRRIVSRELSILQPRPSLAYKIYSLVDTLECGHTQHEYLFDGLRDLINGYTDSPVIRAKRHRCRPCMHLLAKKKPQSLKVYMSEVKSA